MALRPKPIEPLVSDCCGSGCKKCVFDVYEEELKIWERENNEINSENSKLDGLSEDFYTRCELISIKNCGTDLNFYTFEIPNSGRLWFRPGQHLNAREHDGNESIIRPYTLICTEKNNFEVLIKVYKTGRMSRKIREWKIGEFIDWRGPIGDFQHSPNSFDRVIMLAAGTGIAAFYPLVQEILNNPEDETRIHLLYSSQNFDSLPFRAKLNRFTEFWNFQLRYFLSQETDVNRKIKYGENVILGRISKQNLEDCVEILSGKTQFLICGPPSYCEDVKNWLNELGYDSVYSF